MTERVPMSVCVVAATDPQAAQRVRRCLDDQLHVLSTEDLLVRAVDSKVVLLFNAAPNGDPHAFIDGVNDLLNELACDGLIADDDDDGWQWLVDGTGGVNGILGTDDDALNAFLDLLPGTKDSLDNLAKVAVSITTPAPSRAVTVQAPASTASSPSAGIHQR